MPSIPCCPECRFALKLQVAPNMLLRVCDTCGYKVEDKTGGLILETHVQKRSSEGYKLYLNPFTKFDPTLPHIKTIKCPNASCKSNTGGVEKDVIYIKFDAEGMRYLYICTVCDEQWRSRF